MENTPKTIEEQNEHDLEYAPFQWRLAAGMAIVTLLFVIVASLVDRVYVPQWLGGYPVTIRSYPSGARISLDGSSRGTTPQTLVLQPDTDYKITLRLAGYSRWTTKQYFRMEKERKTITPVLVPRSTTWER